jgi:hypothetical protein
LGDTTTNTTGNGKTVENSDKNRSSDARPPPLIDASFQVSARPSASAEARRCRSIVVVNALQLLNACTFAIARRRGGHAVNGRISAAMTAGLAIALSYPLLAAP